MSTTSHVDDWDGLVADEESAVEYEHELALSAFTNAVCQTMRERGISQSDLSRRLRVSRARISQLFRHVSSPTLRTMVQVAHVLGCTVIPMLAPRGFKPVRLYVADDGKNISRYRRAVRLPEALPAIELEEELIAI